MAQLNKVPSSGCKGDISDENSEQKIYSNKEIVIRSSKGLCKYYTADTSSQVLHELKDTNLIQKIAAFFALNLSQA